MIPKRRFQPPGTGSSLIPTVAGQCSCIAIFDVPESADTVPSVAGCATSVISHAQIRESEHDLEHVLKHELALNLTLHLTSWCMNHTRIGVTPVNRASALTAFGLDYRMYGVWRRT